jgi:hypothetical protein
MIKKFIPDKDTLSLPEGVWMDEPDFATWKCATTGYRCYIVRTALTFSLCGYVELPARHPLYRVGISDPIFDEFPAQKPFTVHGGLTFADEKIYSEHFFDQTPEASWFFGFDCAHHRDFLPALAANLADKQIPKEMKELLKMPDATYRDIKFVKSQVKSLATQLQSVDINVKSQLDNLGAHSKESDSVVIKALKETFEQSIQLTK